MWIGNVFLVLFVLALSHGNVNGQAPGAKPVANTTPKPGGAVGNVSNKPVAGGAVGEIVVEIQTPPTTPSNVNSVINAKPADVKPLVTTPKPNIGVTITVKTTPKATPKPVTPPKTPIPAVCPTLNLMTTKTGFLTVPTDPCSYVSCIRADSYLHCAQVKCDPGQGFSQASGRCIASNQCAANKAAPPPANKATTPAATKGAAPPKK